MIYWVLKATSQGTQKYPTTGSKESKENDDTLIMGQKLIFNTEKKSDHLSAESNITQLKKNFWYIF